MSIEFVQASPKTSSVCVEAWIFERFCPTSSAEQVLVYQCGDFVSEGCGIEFFSEGDTENWARFWVYQRKLYFFKYNIGDPDL